MSRVHARLLPSARRAALLAVLGGAALSAQAQEDFSPRTESPVFGVSASGVEPEAPFWEKFSEIARSSFAQDLIGAPIPSAFGQPFEVNAPQGCFGGPGPDVQKARKASLFLLSVYADGNLMQGTGTIISGSGQGGPDRVLTAAHVVPSSMAISGEPSPLVEVLAFDASGAFLARLDPLMVGAQDIGSAIQASANSMSPHPPSAMLQDVAVLEVVEFSRDEVAADWERRGAAIAQTQSGSLMMLSEPPEGWGGNTGMSGAAIFDQTGAVLGISVFAAWPDATLSQASDTGYLGSLLAGTDMPESVRETLQGIQDERSAGAGPEIHRGGRILGLPLVQAELRNLLGVPALLGPGHSPPTAGIIAGYPLQDCVVSSVTISEVPAWKAAPWLDPERASSQEADPSSPQL